MRKKNICLAIVTAALCNYALAAEFDSSAVYVGGEQVDYNSQIYEAQWWTQGDVPSNNDAWKLLSDSQDWTSSKGYSGGDLVIHDGATYKAKWWTKGDEPASDVAVWELVEGNLDSGSDVGSDNESDDSNPVIPEGDYLSYSESATYSVGDQVALNGVLYECKVAGWCSQGGDAYNPEGWASSDAWTNLGVIDDQVDRVINPVINPVIENNSINLAVGGLPEGISVSLHFRSEGSDNLIRVVTNGNNAVELPSGDYHVFEVAFYDEEGNRYQLKSEDHGQAVLVNDMTNNYILNFEMIATSDTKRVGAYFAEWGIYGRNYNITDIPVDLVDDIYYAFLGLKATGEVEYLDGYADFDKRFGEATAIWGDVQVTFPADKWHYPEGEVAPEYFGNFHRLNQLKELAALHLNKDINLFMSIGGWTKSTNFPIMAADPAKRAVFIASSIGAMKKYGFNGLDLDWEFPVLGPQFSYTEKRPQEAIDFLNLIAELKVALSQAGAEDGKQYFLTAAVSAAPQNMALLSYEEIYKHLDWINLMTYDFDGAFDNDTGHQSALYDHQDHADPDFAENEGQWNTDSAVQYLLSKGVPSHQIVIGMPLYARGWAEVSTNNNGLFQVSGTAMPGEYEAGTISYNCLMGLPFATAKLSACQGYEALKYTRIDHNAQGQHVESYYYNPETKIFMTYDDAETIQTKAEYVLQYNLGGGMFWSFDGDAPKEASFPSLIETFYLGVNNLPDPHADAWIQEKSNNGAGTEETGTGTEETGTETEGTGTGTEETGTGTEETGTGETGTGETGTGETGTGETGTGETVAESSLDSLFTQAQFEALFPNRNEGGAATHQTYTYAGLVEAAKRFPSFASVGSELEV